MLSAFGVALLPRELNVHADLLSPSHFAIYLNFPHYDLPDAIKKLRPGQELYLDYGDGYPRKWLTAEQQEQRKAKVAQREKQKGKDRKQSKSRSRR